MASVQGDFVAVDGCKTSTATWMRAQGCKELFKAKDGTFLLDLGSAAPRSVVAPGEVIEGLLPRATSREAAGCESLLSAKESPEE